MSNDAYRLLLDAMEHRRRAYAAMRTGLPSRVISFKAAMHQAVSKWKQYAKLRRAEQ